MQDDEDLRTRTGSGAPEHTILPSPGAMAFQPRTARATSLDDVSTVYRACNMSTTQLALGRLQSMSNTSPRSIAALFRLSLLLTLALGCSAHSEEAAALPEPTDRLSVLSYNVNFGIPGEPSTVAEIRTADADIVLLQETNAEWAEALRQELGDQYAHMDFRHCCRAGGLAVLSRFPITDREYIPAPSGWFPAWRLTAHTPMGDIQLLDVHLHPPVTEDGNWVLGQFTTSGIRLSEIEEYANHLEPGLPTIIAGDFNEGETGSSLQHLAQAGFRNALAEFQPNQPTWRWQTRLGKLRAQLDHILYSKELRAIDARIQQGGQSDHLPVLALFELLARE